MTNLISHSSGQQTATTLRRRRWCRYNRERQS